MSDFEITVPQSSSKPIEYSLEIDCRETRIVGWYKEHVSDDRITIKQLKISDFIFLKDKHPFICIERKRIDDFASSIRDGRYKTQKFDMIDFANKLTPAPFLVYLVEEFSITSDNDMKEQIGQTNITKETILSAITKTMFRDGFQVVFTTDVNDSIRWLNKMWNNMCEAQFEGYKNDESTNHYFNSLSRKMAQRTTSQVKDIERNHVKNWWMLSLTNISGISAAKAQEIIKKYHSARALLDAYDNCSTQEQKAKLLSNMRVNTRRIGDALSIKVYEHVTGDVTQFIKKKKKTKNTKHKKTQNTKIDSLNFDECLIGSDSEGW